MKRTSIHLLALAALCLALFLTGDAQTARDQVETGTMNGASYRIDMPTNWNGILIMYYHGYAQHPILFDKDKPDDPGAGMGAGFAAQGYAVAQSGYSEFGWAVEEAMPETEALRRYVIQKYGKPKETYVTGHSMGGMLTMITMESYPNRYDGGLALCGLLEPTSWAIVRAGAMATAFAYYYPGVLPGPEHIPTSAVFDEHAVEAVMKALPSNPTGLAELMALGHFKTQEDLAGGVAFGMFVLRDMEQKVGGSVLDNENFLYAGGPDDNALNDHVKRYAAKPEVMAYLKTWYTPTGVLLKPMLAVHTTYDPIVPSDSVRIYADQVEHMGSGGNFVQQYVNADGHCHISAQATTTALQELIEWKHSGKRPSSGMVPVGR